MGLSSRIAQIAAAIGRSISVLGGALAMAVEALATPLLVMSENAARRDALCEHLASVSDAQLQEALSLLEARCGQGTVAARLRTLQDWEASDTHCREAARLL